MSAPPADELPSLPLLAIHESISHWVRVELVSGESIKGKLVGVCKETGNVTLEEVLHRGKDLALTVAGRVVVRGSEVRLIVLPDIVKAAPILKNVADTIKQQLKRRKRVQLDAQKRVAGAHKVKDTAAITAKKLLKK